MERFEREITVVDIVMVSLALVSLGLLVYEDVYNPPPEGRRAIVYIDLTIVGIFALEYLVRLSQAKDKKAFVKSHWYDLVGMVPVSHPIFRGFRLARIFRLVVISGRLLRATDRSLGEAFLQKQLTKYRAIVVEELTEPIFVAGLKLTENALVKGDYGSAVARALAQQRDTIANHMVNQMRKDTALNLLLKTPGIGPGIERLPGRVLDGVVETLGAPEIDDAIRQVIREIMADLRRGIKGEAKTAAPST